MSMKDKFPGYYPPTDDEEKTLWENAIFVFDTCSLLNLYSYSEQTRDELLGVLEKIKDRLWMPYQVAAELHKNRVFRISQERKNYSDAIKFIEEFEASLDEKQRSKRQHPFISDSALDTLNKALKGVRVEMEHSREGLGKQLRDDPFFDRICKLFGDRVGNAYEDVRLEQIYSEGRKRYKAMVPPGYMDGDAGGKKAKLEPDRYGDLVLWYETIEHSTKEKKPIVLVTDDGKEDWWRFDPNHNRKLLGPRAELIAEFKGKTKQNCWIYDSESFLNEANGLIHSVSPEAIDEVKHSVESRGALRLGGSSNFTVTPQGVSAVRAMVERQRQIREELDKVCEKYSLSSIQEALRPSLFSESPAQRAFRETQQRVDLFGALAKLHGQRASDTEESPTESEGQAEDGRTGEGQPGE